MSCILAAAVVINSHSSSFMECACLFFSLGIVLMLNDIAPVS